jgi:hypothetical protein
VTYPPSLTPSGNWKRVGAERHQTFRREIREMEEFSFRLMSVRMTPASGRIERQRPSSGGNDQTWHRGFFAWNETVGRF